MNPCTTTSGTPRPLTARPTRCPSDRVNVWRARRGETTVPRPVGVGHGGRPRWGQAVHGRRRGGARRRDPPTGAGRPAAAARRAARAGARSAGSTAHHRCPVHSCSVGPHRSTRHAYLAPGSSGQVGETVSGSIRSAQGFRADSVPKATIFRHLNGIGNTVRRYLKATTRRSRWRQLRQYPFKRDSASGDPCRARIIEACGRRHAHRVRVAA